MNYRERQYRDIIEAVAQLFDDLTLSNTASEVRKMVKEVEVLPDDFAPDLTFKFLRVDDVLPGDRVLDGTPDDTTLRTVHAVDSNEIETRIRFTGDVVFTYPTDFRLEVCRNGD